MDKMGKKVKVFPPLIPYHASQYFVRMCLGYFAVIISLFLLDKYNGGSLFDKFLFLSYEVEAEGESGKGYLSGPDDVWIVLSMTLLLIVLRHIFSTYLIKPFGLNTFRMKRKKAIKLCESSWLGIYYFISLISGSYLYFAGNEHPWDLKYLWIGYPFLPHSAATKFYYLGETAFWFQCIFVLFVEDRRKDFPMMLLHHIVTIGLLSASYWNNFIRVGILVCVNMDIADLILYNSKSAVYMKYTNISEAGLHLFVPLWIITRHIFLPMITWSVFYDMVEVLGAESKWKPEIGWYWVSGVSNVAYGWAFLILQVLLLIWLYAILRLAWKQFMKGGELKDSRSDDSDEEKQD